MCLFLFFTALAAGATYMLHIYFSLAAGVGGQLAPNCCSTQPLRTGGFGIHSGHNIACAYFFHKQLVVGFLQFARSAQLCQCIAIACGHVFFTVKHQARCI